MADSDFNLPTTGRTPRPAAGERLTLLPDAKLAAALMLEQRLEVAGRQVTGANFASLLDSLLERMIADAFQDVRAQVGLILLKSSEGSELTVAYQAGSAGADWRGRKIPQGRGGAGWCWPVSRRFAGISRATTR